LNIQSTAQAIVNGGGSIPPSATPQERQQLTVAIDNIRKSSN